MSPQQIKSKWRPPLSWIVFGVLLTVLSLPAAIVIGFRAIEPTTSRMGPMEIVAIGVALLLTLGIAAVLSRTITGPVNALIRTTDAIARGGPVPVEPPARHGTRELAVLSQSFLDLAARLVERTDYVHSFAAHVSHELKSPLTAIRGSAELLLDETMPAADRNRFVEHIIADSDRLDALLERLRTLARAEVPLGVKGVTVRRAAELLQLKVPALSITVDGDDAPMGLSEEAAGVVLSHLADNAIQHGATELALTAQVDPSTVRLRVADNGPGINPGDLTRIFEPFYTTRRDGGGTGMGLGIVRTMLMAHGGSIAPVPSERGAAFEIVVPRL